MFGFLCKRLLPKLWVVGDSASTQLGFVQTTLLMIPIKSLSSSSSSSTSVKDELLGQPFAVSYLINSCGFSLEGAISASQRVHFEAPGRPDSVLNLLRDHGFTNTHITKLLRSRPAFLLANPEKTFLPKLEFFRSIAVPSTDLPKLLSSNPDILATSLENHIMPWYNFLKSLLLDDKKVIKVMKNAWVLTNDVTKNFAPNISVLRELGVPESRVLGTVIAYSYVFGQSRDRFDKIVKEVIELGYNPTKAVFVHAMLAISGTSKSTREHKIEVYRRWGLSEDDVQLVLQKCPLLMLVSEKKVMTVMDFPVNKMDWEVAAIARYPLVLCYSLEKRVIPRCLVIKVLLFKGLIKKDFSLSTILHRKEKLFLEKFVTRYKEDVPQLLNVYKGKTSLLELGFGSEEMCGMKLL